MVYPEFLQEVRKVKLDHIRSETLEYFEVVIPKESLKAMLDVMNRYFGDAAKPEGQKPSQEQQHLTARFGGIRVDQILYLRAGREDGAMAMFWPWNSGELITVKIYRGAALLEAQKAPGIFGKIINKLSPGDGEKN